MPHPDDLDKIETDPLSVRSIAYDLVLNGWELGSGSIRIHEPELQRGCSPRSGSPTRRPSASSGSSSTRSTTGHPPHGGFAFGLDRLVAILAGEENIREVIAFPKTQSGQDPMTSRTPARRSASAGVGSGGGVAGVGVGSGAGAAANGAVVSGAAGAASEGVESVGGLLGAAGGDGAEAAAASGVGVAPAVEADTGCGVAAGRPRSTGDPVDTVFGDTVFADAVSGASALEALALRYRTILTSWTSTARIDTATQV
jgi:hypothetical protein